MDREIFAAGVAPGGPATLTEVKILCCHMLAETPEMSFEVIHEALREHRLVNYFELISALSQLCDTGHLTLLIDLESYRITDIGRAAAQELSSHLPYAVLEKAVTAAQKILKRQKRLQEVVADIRAENAGYVLTMSLEGELMSFSVFTPTQDECERLRRRFLNDPVYIYKCVMALLSGRRDILGEPIPSGEDLF